MKQCCLFVAITLFAAAPACCDDAKLQEIIEQVRRNERLYDDIEVVMRSTYDIGRRQGITKKGGAGAIGSENVRTELLTRYVSQGERFRVEVTGKSRDAQGGESPEDRVREFDGNMTRALEPNGAGVIFRARDDGPAVRPHMLLIRHMHYAVPFSVYLSGHEAILAHPSGGRWEKGHALKVSYEGTGTFNGLKCHKVYVDTLIDQGQPHDGRLFWIAEHRNYLPVREFAFTYRTSKDEPLAQSTVRELREIQPGAWFPVEVETIRYNSMLLQKENSRELQWRQRYVVDKVELNPQYEPSFFNQITFPPGTQMYEWDRGKIVRSWKEGEPEVTEQDESVPRVRPRR